MALPVLLNAQQRDCTVRYLSASLIACQKRHRTAQELENMKAIRHLESEMIILEQTLTRLNALPKADV